MEHQFYVQTTKEEFDIMNSIRKASDMTTLFSEQELSGLTLEQKMLAGLYIPRKKKDPNEIEIVDWPQSNGNVCQFTILKKSSFSFNYGC